MLSRSDQKGFVGSIVGVFVLSFLLIGATVFGIWAFTSRSDFKNNSDKISAVAVDKALATQKEQLEKDFLEREKQPFDTFTGPSEQGSVKFQFPKTWEIYAAVVSTNNATPIDAYAHPNYVPGLTGTTALALRFQVLNQDYATILKTFDSQVKLGTAKVSPIRVAKVQSVLGSRIDGKIDAKNTGAMVLLPLRDKVLKIWTESNTYVNDFNQMLTTLEFSP